MTKVIWILSSLFMALTLFGCQINNPNIDQKQLSGIWLKSIPNTQFQEGLWLKPDGDLRFINIYSMKGDIWELNSRNDLVLSSHTANYPKPIAKINKIIHLDSEKLILNLKEHVYTKARNELYYGEYTYLADAARFKHCKTGKTYPILFSGDHISMERRYLSMQPKPGEWIAADVRGVLTTVASVDSSKPTKALYITEFIRFDRTEGCSKH
jgi:copper homeostasis protein (lipoprotein)